MEKKYLVGADLGTSSVRAAIFDFSGKEISSHQIEAKVINGAGGSVTLDGNEYEHNLQESVRVTIEKSGINPDEIAAVSFGGMRGTIAAYDKDGKILNPFVSCLDTSYMTMLNDYEKAKAEFGIDSMGQYYEIGNGRPTTCNLIMARIKKEKPELYDSIYKYGNSTLMAGRAFGMQDYLMDSDNANLHGFYNVYERKGSEKMTRLWEHLGLRADKVAEPTVPGTLVGHVTRDAAEKTGLPEGTPIIMGSGDQQCNDLGAGVVNSGMFSICLGTIGIIVMRSNGPIKTANSQITINGAAINGWMCQGVIIGVALKHKWLRDLLFAKELEEEKNGNGSAFAVMDKEALAAKLGAHGLLFLPWDNGRLILGDNGKKGGFIGLEFSHTRGDMVRALYEGFGYEISMNIKALMKATGEEAKVIRMTGGCARSEVWMQIVADFCNCPLEILEGNEFGTLGSAMLAGVGCGVFADLDEAVDKMVRIKKRIEPNPESVEFYKELSDIYQGIYQTTCNDAYNDLTQYKRKNF